MRSADSRRHTSMSSFDTDKVERLRAVMSGHVEQDQVGGVAWLAGSSATTSTSALAGTLTRGEPDTGRPRQHLPYRVDDQADRCSRERWCWSRSAGCDSRIRSTTCCPSSPIASVLVDGRGPLDGHTVAGPPADHGARRAHVPVGARDGLRGAVAAAVAGRRWVSSARCRPSRAPGAAPARRVDASALHAAVAVSAGRTLVLQHRRGRARRAGRPRCGSTVRGVPPRPGVRAAGDGRHRVLDGRRGPPRLLLRHGPRDRGRVTCTTAPRRPVGDTAGVSFRRAAAWSRRSTTSTRSAGCCSPAVDCRTARACCRRASVEAMTTDHIGAEPGAAGPSPDGSQGWGFGVSVQVRRRGLGPTVGGYGWAGGLGTSWANDPGEAPRRHRAHHRHVRRRVPAAGGHPGLLDLRVRRDRRVTRHVDCVEEDDGMTRPM